MGVYYSAGKKGEAEAILKKAIEADPNSPLARLSLASFYSLEKRTREAEEQIRPAM